MSSPFPPPGPGPGMASTMEAEVAAMEAAAAASATAAARWALAILALALTSAKVLAPVLLMIGKGGLGETWLADSNAGDPWILETWIWKRGKCINKLEGKALSHSCFLSWNKARDSRQNEGSDEFQGKHSPSCWQTHQVEYIELSYAHLFFLFFF